MTTMTRPLPVPADWRDFLALTKPGVMRLVVFTGLCGLLAAPVSVYLGRISFAFYLVHGVTIAALSRALSWTLRPYSPAVHVAHLVAVAAAATALAVLLHHLVEVPAERRLRGSRRPGSAAASAGLPPAREPGADQAGVVRRPELVGQQREPERTTEIRPLGDQAEDQVARDWAAGPVVGD